MAINVSNANAQAVNIQSNIAQLRDAKMYLQRYENELNNSWQGSEVLYYNNAINNVIAKIDSIIRDMESIANDVKNTASQIKREEDAAAAAAAAAAARNKRIMAAQNEYDKAKKQLDELLKEKEKLEKTMKKSFWERITKADDLEKLEKQIEEAEKNCNQKYKALQTAKR